MRVPAFPIVASLVLLAAPAFAQTGTTGTNTDQNGATGYTNNVTGTSNQNGTNGYSNSGAYNQQNGATGYTGSSNGAYNQQNGAPGYASNGSQNTPNVTADTRDRIRQSLLQSGFRDVSVMPEAFIIRAQAPDGSHVVMLLRPDALTGVVEQTGSSTAPGNWNSGNSGNNGSANMNNGAGYTGNGTGR